jgi:hypothetical protein
MNAIVIQNLIIIAVFFISFLNYIFTSMALFKISKVEKVGKPWFAWIPVLNDFLLIKIGKGNIWITILAAVSFLVGGPVATQITGINLGIIGTIISAAWIIYKVIMYKGICERYNVNILIFAAGFLFQLITSMALLGILVSIVGHVLLYIKAKKGIQGKIIVESKVIFSKLNKKKKSVK